MQLLERLSETPLIIWVAESNYGYPIILTFHSLGMALLIGLLLVINIRVLGFPKSIYLTSLRQFFLVAWIGLVINVISGSLLFLANSSAFLHNTAFLTKITCLFIGGIGTYWLFKELKISKPITEVSIKYSSSIDDTPEIISQRARVIAVVCILLWMSAIVAGRIVGYTSIPE